MSNLMLGLAMYCLMMMVMDKSLLELVAADSRAPKHNKHAPDNDLREKNMYIYTYIYIYIQPPAANPPPCPDTVIGRWMFV